MLYIKQPENHIAMLNLRTLFFLFATLLFNNQIFSQSKNAAYVELLGNGIIISANYDVRFSKNEGGLGVRIGFGYLGDVSNHNGAVQCRSYICNRIT